MRLSIVQLGRGQVGGALVRQVEAAREAVLGRYGVDLRHALVAGRAEGADPEALVRRAARDLQEPRLLVDATAADGMAGVQRLALQNRFHVITCNKKPLSGSLADFTSLRVAARKAARFHLGEVTVGAGLPVLSTLENLRDSGDRVASIEGCFSGTLNFLCAALDRGDSFSAAVAEARRLGYTEPDPRDDLDGRDAGRKALILARFAGLLQEPDETRVQPFCAFDRSQGRELFLAGLATLDFGMKRRWEEAAGRGKRLRYVASVTLSGHPAAGGYSTGLEEVEADHPLARLSGAENIFVFTSERYHRPPLVVSGPGAGPAVTAAGAFGDILTVVRALAAGVGTPTA